MVKSPKNESFSGEVGPANRQELLEARAKLERQIAELSYRAIIGSGFSPSAKPELIDRLKDILAKINRKLAETDS